MKEKNEIVYTVHLKLVLLYRWLEVWKKITRHKDMSCFFIAVNHVAKKYLDKPDIFPDVSFDSCLDIFSCLYI